MTDIQLPPLPHWCEAGSPFATHMQAYARAAIEAERLHTDNLLRSSVPERWKSCASPVGAVQSYIAELEAAIEAHEAREASVVKQEPVAWRTFDGEGGYEYRSYDGNETYAEEWAKRNPRHVGWVEPLYTHPVPMREPLSDEQIDLIYGSNCGDGGPTDICKKFARAIEAAHGITKDTP